MLLGVCVQSKIRIVTRLSEEPVISIATRTDNLQVPLSATPPPPSCMGAVQLIAWYKSLLQLHF
jgi:hypothetical protein